MRNAQPICHMKPVQMATTSCPNSGGNDVSSSSNSGMIKPPGMATMRCANACRQFGCQIPPLTEQCLHDRLVSQPKHECCHDDKRGQSRTSNLPASATRARPSRPARLAHLFPACQLHSASPPKLRLSGPRACAVLFPHAKSRRSLVLQLSTLGSEKLMSRISSDDFLLAITTSLSPSIFSPRSSLLH